MPQKTSDWEIFADVSEKKRQGKRGKWVKIEKKRRKGGKLEIEVGKVIKIEWGLFFFFFFFFLLVTFENDGNLFWIYQNGNFLPGKCKSRREKNQEKWLCPLRKICLLRPCYHVPSAHLFIFLWTWLKTPLDFQTSLSDLVLSLRFPHIPLHLGVLLPITQFSHPANVNKTLFFPTSWRSTHTNAFIQ